MHQKGLGQKKSKHNLHGNCQKKKKHSSWYTTANRQRQHCWQMQVKRRKGKGKMMLGNDVGPERWRKQGSYTGYLLLSQKDSHLSHFRIHNWFHCAGAAQWSSLRATDVPLVQLSDLAWLPSGCFVAMQKRQEDWETTDQIHSVSHQLSYRAQHSSNMCRTTVFSPSFLSPSTVFSFSPNQVAGSSAGSVRSHTCDRMCGSQPPTMRCVRCSGVSVCEWCVWASCVSRGTRQWSLIKDADNQPRGMPFSCLNTGS